MHGLKISFEIIIMVTSLASHAGAKFIACIQSNYLLLCNFVPCMHMHNNFNEIYVWH